MKSKLFSFFVFCLLSFIFYFFSCSPTNPSDDTVTFSGTVTLEDTTDYSGVTVSLYAPVELDTALVRINQQYPNIGVQISQETEFDHREREALYSTTTDKNGNWKISGVKKGSYNLVAEKEGWGWKYAFENINNREIKLYKVKRLSGLFNENLTLLKEHHYIINGDITVNSNYNFNIENGVWIRFAGSYKIELYGNVNIAGKNTEYVKFLCEKNKCTKWRFIKIEGENSVNIKYIVLKNSSRGIKLNDNETFNIENIALINNEVTGLHINSVRKGKIKNIYITKSTQGLLSQYSENVGITNCLFFYNEQGIKLEYSQNDIENNLFKKNENGIFTQFRPSSIMKNNEFVGNKYGLRCAGCDPLVKVNSFYDNEVAIWIGAEYFSTNSKPIINYNNLLNSSFLIKITGSEVGLNKEDINATNNWWGTINETDIDKLIWDKYDAETDSIYIGEILYKPFMISKIDSAGINIE